jgi:ABC-2 type transport system permease protein
VITSPTVNQARSLAWRSIVRQARQPAHVIPPLLFPLALLAVNSGGLHAATRLPGFPTKSFVAFALAVPFIQGALFATLYGGADLARDIQTGFLNRLALTPMRGSAVIAGHLAGVVAQGIFQTAFYLVVGLGIGVGIHAGIGGGLVILLLAALVCLGFGAFGSFVALQTGSGEATQATFPIFFVFLFISSMNMPRNLLGHTWFRIAATINPVSYLIEGFRSLVIQGWNFEALGLAFGVATAFAIIAITLSSLSLKRRMTRT